MIPKKNKMMVLSLHLSNIWIIMAMRRMIRDRDDFSLMITSCNSQSFLCNLGNTPIYSCTTIIYRAVFTNKLFQAECWTNDVVECSLVITLNSRIECEARSCHA